MNGNQEIAWGQPDKMLVTWDGVVSHPGGVAILLVASYYKNWRYPLALMGLQLAHKVSIGADFTFFFTFSSSEADEIFKLIKGFGRRSGLDSIILVASPFCL